MENTKGQNTAKAVNKAENNNDTTNGEFGVEQVESALLASMQDEFAESAPDEAENSEETPEVESEGVEESTSVHSESHEETTAEYEEPETEEQSDDEDNEETGRGLPKGVKKRIDKLVAKRREAEQEVERMKLELERLEQEAKKPARAQEIRKNPYAELSSHEQVFSEIEKAKQIRRWCEMHPEGTVVKDASGNETDYSAEQVRTIKVRTIEALEEHLPSQLAYINNFQQVEKVASKEYPWWKDKTSKERQIAEAFIQHFPEITRFPDYKMVLGDYIRGLKSRQGSQQSVGSQRVPSQPKSVNAPRSQPNRQVDVNTATQRFRSSGGKEDLTDIIASKFL